MNKMLRMGSGSGCMVLGLAGIVLPVMPGWLFIFAGMIILSKDVPFFHRMVERFRRLPGFNRLPQRFFHENEKSPDKQDS